MTSDPNKLAYQFHRSLEADHQQIEETVVSEPWGLGEHLKAMTVGGLP